MVDSVPIEQLTIDDVSFVVADLSEEIQGAVRKYEEWRERYAVAADEVQLVASALRDLGAQIVAAVRTEEEQKAAAEAAAAAAEPEVVLNTEGISPVDPSVLVVDDQNNLENNG